MHIQQIDRSKLSQYATVSIAYEVTTELHVCPIHNGLGGLQLVEKPCVPYVKDYDLLPDCHPLSWTKQFNIDELGLFLAIENGMYVGAAAVAPEMEGTATLWDLRVQPGARGKGIGGKLLEAVFLWSKERDYHTLMAETQNVNTPACTFYSGKGFILETIDQHGYSDSLVEDEVKLIWSLDLKLSSM
ncbi:GNAT family N-acetyltransferase [Bacillus sp. es.034]|uniref:GNAT family N-acetyltransferase n=1 Tax=Bacillus sp. es.034 TaxID=1761763 RepID=UPI000BF334EE|nr:GNAT family N-acetyltransferase [Bacillus sp. es.034]PFG03505.1 acetyltransferase (GNAT) family protein [Bacillus sp. es.034]